MSAQVCAITFFLNGSYCTGGHNVSSSSSLCTHAFHINRKVLKTKHTHTHHIELQSSLFFFVISIYMKLYSVSIVCVSKRTLYIENIRIHKKKTVYQLRLMGRSKHKMCLAAGWLANKVYKSNRNELKVAVFFGRSERGVDLFLCAHSVCVN